MKNDSILLVGLGLLFGASACERIRTDVVAPQARPVGHVSVAFVGFTNRAITPPFEGTGLEEVSDVADAAFLVSNNTSSRLICQVTVDAFRPASNKPEVHIGEPLFLSAHATEMVFVPAFGGTNGWRYEVVASSPDGEEAFMPVTNLWTIP